MPVQYTPAELIAADDSARRDAVDPRYSFIVQAPAGAGKTELLTNRFLALLAVVDSPEQIVAMTFTNKAADEMRARILSSLREATVAGHNSSDGHHATRLRLAHAALQRSCERGWRILERPQQLRISTIDAFNRAVLTRVSLVTGMAVPPVVCTDASSYYRVAVEQTLRACLANDDGALYARLLLLFDNNAEAVVSTMTQLLAFREQWLPMITEDATYSARDTVLLLWRRLVASLSGMLDERSVVLARLVMYATLYEALTTDTIGQLPPRQHQLPDDDHAFWRRCAAILLTSSGGLRKSVRATDGFPPRTTACSPPATVPAQYLDLAAQMAEPAGRQAMKDECVTLLAQLSADSEHIVPLLRALQLLPSPDVVNDDAASADMRAIFRLLRLAYAQLRVLFADNGVTDFTESAITARLAVGTADSPPLALSETQCRHLLVDEFQDISYAQYALLAQLTAHWAGGETLFCVGDPMQSIYRFRQADVSLFAHVQAQGIGHITLRSLRLYRNFRSDKAIVDTCNAVFAEYLGDRDSALTGRVAFSPAFAVNNAQTTAASARLYYAEDEAALIARVCDSVAMQTDGHIALLAPKAQLLAPYVEALIERHIEVQQVGTVSLSAAANVRDAYAVTRLLLDSYDDNAWLSLLRSPLIGLPLSLLVTIADLFRHQRMPRLQLLQQITSAAGVEDGVVLRLQHLHSVFSNAIAAAAPVAAQVRAIWYGLGGRFCSLTAQHDVDAYCRQLVAAGTVGDWLAAVDTMLEAGRLDRGKADARVTCTTIHKAKGLEFDHVYIIEPFRRGNRDTHVSLRWLRYQDAVYLAAKSPIQQSSSLFDAIHALYNAQQDGERRRLHYVAATRAKHTLTLAWSDSGNHALIDACVAADVPIADVSTAVVAETGVADVWQQDRIRPPSLHGVERTDTLASTEFSWAGTMARALGTAAHQLMQAIATEGVALWQCDWPQRGHDFLDNALHYLHVNAADRAYHLPALIDTFSNCLTDRLCHWLWYPHPQHASEYTLSVVDDNGITNTVIIDRTFVVDDVRWIIDYKFSVHSGGDVDTFLAQEKQRYQQQLCRYAEVIAAIDARPIRLALFFPHLRRLIAWDHVADQTA